MYIKYDDSEMIEFFEERPITVGEEGGGIFIFSVKDNIDLSMILTMDIYKKSIDISILYQNNTIFKRGFDNNVEIKKSEKCLVFKLEDGSNILLKKYPCLGMFIEK